MTDVIIVGGGLAGLTAANYLQQKNISFLLLEASDRVGGRVKTDTVNGFLLDRGFQVLLTAYPEAKRLLNYEKLNLQKFKPGAALLMPNGKIETIGDPLRDISSLIPTLTSSAGSISDKFGILKMRSRLNDKSIEEIFSQKEETTLEALQNDYGFSDKMIERFFRPFFSGIFLENNLATSRRMFDFVFKMFGEGYAAVPNEGMEAIPRQLAGNLPSDNIYTNCKVNRIEGNKIFINDGEIMQARNILLSTEATSLVKDHFPKTNTLYVSTLHLHFLSESPALTQPLIGLNTLAKKLANNICTINKVAPGYAPSGENLISISIVGKPALKETEVIPAVKKELSTWFGKEVASWEYLHSHLVEYALPVQSHVTYATEDETVRLSKNRYMCGDHSLNGSIDAAMLSGRRAAEVIEKDLGA